MTFKTENTCGGFLGIGATTSFSTIKFEQNEYFAGDQAKVKFICDNSKCKKPVKHFKLKLHLKVVVRDNDKFEESFQEYTQSLRFPGCLGNAKVERECVINVGLNDLI